MQSFLDWVKEVGEQHGAEQATMAAASVQRLAESYLVSALSHLAVKTEEAGKLKERVTFCSKEITEVSFTWWRLR
jgi:hypothetical protein